MIIYLVNGDDLYDQDINEEGYAKCRKSGCLLNSIPFFILYLLIKCRNHPNYQKAEKMSIFNALSIVSFGELGLCESEVKKLIQKILLS